MRGVYGACIVKAATHVNGAAVFHHNGLYIHHVGFLVEPVDAKKPGRLGKFRPFILWFSLWRS